MSILGRAMGAEERATSTLRSPASWLIQALSGGAVTASGQTVSATTAMGNSAVYACIRALSDTAASLPLRTYKHTDGGRELVKPLPGLNTAGLLEQPMPGLPQANFIANAVTNLNAYGNAFWAKIKRSDGTLPYLLLPIRPSRVSIRLQDGEPLFTVVQGDGSSFQGKDLTRGEILHIKGLTFDGIMGVSPIAQARTALGLGMALEEFAARFFANSAIPGGVIKTQKSLSDEAAVRLKRDWEALHRGTRNSSRVAVLEDGMEWQAVTGGLADAQFVEQRRLSATEVARIFRVPPWVIAADSGSSMTYSNVEQQLTAFLTFSVRPWLVFIEQGLAADDDLFPVDRSVFPEFYIDALLKADAATRAIVYQRGLAGHGWLTVNDVRRSENLDVVEDGDVVPAATPPKIHDPGVPSPDPTPNADGAEGDLGGAGVPTPPA